MTDEEAEVLLKRLQEHFHQPVLPLGRVCKALNQWAECIKANQRAPLNTLKYPHDYAQHGHSYASILHRIEIDIEKSGLLYRLLYLGEPLRTRMCPTHKGHMNCNMWVGGCDPCEHGCQGTGWLPEAG